MTPGYQPFLPRGSLKIFSLYNTHLLWLLENNHLLFPRKHYAKLSKTPYKKKKLAKRMLLKLWKITLAR